MNKIFLNSLIIFFLFQTFTSKAQVSKIILIKSVESYVLLNYSHLYEIFFKEKFKPLESIYAEVDSEFICIKGFQKGERGFQTVFCLYEGKNFEIYDIIYGDLNNDGEMDAIVSFSLEGFAGGNGYGRFYASLISTKGNSLVSAVNHYYPQIDFNSINKGIIYGKQYGYDEHDPHCCPSLIKDVIYQFADKDLKFVKEFEFKKAPESKK